MKNWRSHFLEWLKEIVYYGDIGDYVEFVEDSNPPNITKVRVYTHDYKYVIVAKENYLGCVYVCRKPRAGEGWSRGRDLPDGKFNRKTWEKIKNSIIKHELVKIAKSARLYDNANVEEPINEHGDFHADMPCLVK